MPARTRCLACGAEVPYAASFCPRCGRSTAPVMRDLERLDAPGGPVAREQAVARTVGGGSRRRGIAALAALAAVLGGIVLLLSGGGDQGDNADADAAAAPTTTRPGSPHTRLIYPESTRPGETTSTRPPTTSRPPTTTSTTTTLVTYIEGAKFPLGSTPGPVLGEATGGLSLYVVGDGSIRRVELDTGRVTTLATSDRAGQEIYAIELLEDRLVLGGTGTYEVARDLSGGVTPSSRQPSFGLRVLGTDQHWTYEGRDTGVQAVLWGGAGEIGRFDVPPGINPIGVVGDRLVLVGGGRIYTLDRGGAIHLYGVGTVVSASGGWMLWWSCDATARCAYQLGDVTDPDVKPVHLPDGYAPGMYGMMQTAAVSPDGEYVLLNGGFGLRLIRTSTGELVGDRELAWSSTWSPDSQWLFEYTDSGSVEAVATADGRVVELLRSVGHQQNGQRMLAVG